MDKILIINPGENLQDKLFRVNKKSNLILKPSPRCSALQVTLKTNYPIKKNSKFIRNKYYPLTISADHQDLISSAFNWTVSLALELAGTFHFICSTSEGEEIWQAYVIVNPEMKVPLDAIKCQTVLSKNLGPLSEWRKRLTLTKDCKYNMVHFTPVQELGGSNSAYSIKNQLKVNKLFGASLDGIKKEIEFMEKKWHILSITDIVLNHTSNDSVWIREHPECAYNLSNSPHLRPAFLLDSAFIWLVKDILNGSLKTFYELSTVLQTERDLKNIGILLKTFYVPQLKIYEFYLLDIQDAISRFESLPRGEKLEEENFFKRFGNKVTSIPDSITTTGDLKKFLEAENLRRTLETKGFLDYAINNALNAIGYERLNPAGPFYRKPLGEDTPLIAPYFLHTGLEEFSITREETLMYIKGEQFMAHNGWVMGSDCRDDFAGPGSMVYLKRELIAWGDCIKLRYGSCREEVPYLWGHIQEYVERQAKTFHGFRIDNCHSTPLHVAEFVVDVARSVRPDIYIMAELFTSSESADNIFVNRLGITSLIRESMSAQDARELGRLIYRFGGSPVGAFYLHGGELLKPGVAHAIFFDQTHDNDSPIIRRSPFDIPATTAIINMAICATGSNRGYDELVPHHINVVSENRLYQPEVDRDAGILPLRRFLNETLQKELSQGFDEIFVDQVNDDIIAITRHNPADGRSIVLVARTAFCKDFGPSPTPIIPVQGLFKRVILEAQATGDPSRYIPNSQYINGLSSFKIKIISQDCKPEESQLAKFSSSEVRLEQFLPSSVLAFELVLTDEQTEALRVLNQWSLESKHISFMDANHILFRTPEEDNVGTYALPNIGNFTYCGLYGLMYYLERVRDNQDQAHPLAMNLRDGNWLSEYILSWLRRKVSTEALADHLEIALRCVNILPRGMVPKYFDVVITKLYNFILDSIYSSMSSFISKGPSLVKLLTLSSFALIGECDSASLPEVDSKLQSVPSIAAGLPHFASGYMRNWGRDTFISLRGLLLIPGRFVEAKSIILSYARTLKNGLIPNLLDGGYKSRYNCRDAVWWWLYCIREYTKMAPNGAEILRCKVKRIHKPQRRRSTAQMNGTGDSSSMSLCDVIQEAIECHFRGTKFVEENKGKQLDEHMEDEGFNIAFGVNRETGFVFGGNEYNCGTWMDKMGSSEKAGTKGKPASPRDGSAVELVGLSKAVVNWLDEMYSKGRFYPYDGVECLYDNTITLKWTWKRWASIIQSNFEKYFYIPLDGKDPNPKLINRKGIYKDTVGASLTWQDYQLRPNFLIAMVVAPELFDTNHAKYALKLAKENLCGPLGMKTLDPTDWNYCGDYDNSNDSKNPKVAHGFNYHQGPEWLWLTGYYVRASTKFVGVSERSHHLELLGNFYSTLIESPWLGLPELTNLNGKSCPDSCPIQAWSIATAIEALYETARTC